MSFTDKNITMFIQEVSGLMLVDYRNANFRIQVLELIEKYFRIKKSTFVLFHDDNYEENDIDTIFSDNITHGVSKDSIYDFYKKYYTLNDVYSDLNFDNSVIRLSDVLDSKKNFEAYKNYFLKYGSVYQVGMGIFSRNRIVGFISLSRNTSAGDFTDFELEQLKIIQSFLNNEFSKILNYENKMLESLALEDRETVFPMGLIILDENYVIVHKNTESKDMVRELIKDKAINFRFYFMDKVVAENLVDDGPEDNMFEISNYKFKVRKKFQNDEYAEIRKLFFFVYFMKNESLKVKNKYYELLTEREKEVAQLIKTGLSNKEIGEKLNISPFTVKTHIQKVYLKCDVKNKVQLVYKLFNN